VAKINQQPEFIKKMEAGGFVLTDTGYAKMPAFVEKMKAEYSEGAKILGIIK
jgi:hypothetical protein